jgi:3-methyladenine DNA glycosylase AlkD
MLVGNDKRQQRTLHWAQSRDRWHRRAAAVALIRAARLKQSFAQIRRVTEVLLVDEDDMVQKGLGWLLREAAKFDPKSTVAYLLKIRARAPRLVLRTACETLPPHQKGLILGHSISRSARSHAAGKIQ